jgi:hypothetical protein
LPRRRAIEQTRVFDASEWDRLQQVHRYSLGWVLIELP